MFDRFVVDFSQTEVPCPTCGEHTAYTWNPTCALCGKQFHVRVCGVTVRDDRGDDESYCTPCASRIREVPKGSEEW